MSTLPLPKRRKGVGMLNIKNKSVYDNSNPMVESSKIDDNEVDSSEYKYLLSHLGDYKQEPFDILASYFEGRPLERLTRHQIESYNHFVNFQMQRTVEMFNPVTIRSDNDYDILTNTHGLVVKLCLKNLRFQQPQIYENNGATKTMMPQEARLRNFTYSSGVLVDLHVEYIIRNQQNQEDTITKCIPNVKLCNMPVMLKSSICVLNQSNPLNHVGGECPMDCGGYFIIKGSEKTVLCQERAAENRIYVFNAKNTPKWNWMAEFKSVPDSKSISPKQVEMMISSKTNVFGNAIYVVIPRLKQKRQIELFVLFRALGVLSDKAICEYILLNVTDEKNKVLLQYLQASIDDASQYIKSKETIQQDALEHVMSMVAYNPYQTDKGAPPMKKMDYTLEIFKNDLLPHCKSSQQKLYLLGFMVKRLIQTALGWNPPDDRDSYLNKRIDLTGSLLNNLFRNHYIRFVKDIEKQVIREINIGAWRSTEDYENIINMTNIYKIFKPSTIENGLNRALSTGDFSVKQSSSSSKVGVAQVLNRLTYLGTLSHLRRVNTPLEKNGELVAPRKLHNTTWGFLCLTGDSEVLMSDRITIKKMKDMRDGDRVNTVNPETLLDEPSDIHSFFQKMPDKLYEITTISGRKIKATANHPFLINNNGKPEWKNLKDLKKDDKIIIRHVVNIMDVLLKEMDVAEEKRKTSAPSIEYLKIKDLNPTTDITFEEFTKENKLNNGCISVPILSIDEIEPEFVYDFTTRSNNHSFVASSFVTHNCPVETPEGQSIGIVKNLSFMTHMTIPTNSESLYEIVQPYIIRVEDAQSPQELWNLVKVFINGTWVGGAKEPLILFRFLKQKKHQGIINIYTSISFHFARMEIRICNDGGRLTRPVLKVQNNKVLITHDIIEKLNKKELQWNDLLTECRLKDSVIEYIDPEEQNTTLIAMKFKEKYLQEQPKSNSTSFWNYEYCEIHPCVMLGVLASCIPFPDCNQAPRNTYQCAMAKQAIGISSINYDLRMDKTSYILNYPSRPLVDTRLMDFLQLNRIPSGCQIHVAIMSYTGYNQEDSVLINQGAIDRGLFMATIYHTEKDEDKNVIRDEIIRCKPDPTKTKSIKHGNYQKLNIHGFIPENTEIENRDIIIAKVAPIKENRNDPTKIIKYEDQSKSFRTTEETYIDKNFTGRNGEGCNFAKSRVRILRKPTIGDKVSSRHGQKGTIGNIIPENEMPFTKDGLRPDLILNPHAIPSRMTIAHLKETLLGKVLISLGMFGDGTSFGDLDVYNIANELQKCGFESYGNEILYDGATGKQLETSIFIGPVYYQRLKHMVNDKEHSRSIGPVVNLTRQPAEGRSRDGGFRVGEMERDVMIAHGISKFCRERLYSVADKYAVHVCKKCGMIAAFNNGDKGIMRCKQGMTVHKCSTCDNLIDFAYVEIPYAFKLMMQELQTINIVPRMITT